ncbi:glycoside hydrolase [candidate division KSB1 bacterium]|nr:glycoside hydrolase [candidate division KSB1 bacterium]
MPRCVCKYWFILLQFVFLSTSFVIYAQEQPVSTTKVEIIDVRQLKNSFTRLVVAGQGYFPVIAANARQEIFIVLRGGARHMGVTGRLDLVTSTDGGMTWSQPRVLVDSEKDDRNPAFGITHNGTLVLAYHWQAGYDETGKWAPAPEKQDTKITFSADGGQSWEPPILLQLEIQRGNSPFGKMFTDAKGTLYMPIYGAKNPEPGVRVKFDPNYSFVLGSSDDGRTWTEVGTLAPGLNEAAYLILPNGEWLAAARSQLKEEQAIYLCRSADQGQTWSTPARITEAMEHPPDLVRLGDGSILLVFGVRHQPFSIQGMLSRDQGHTWLQTRLLFADQLPGTDIGYPSTVRLKNGRLISVFYQTGYKKTAAAEPVPACEAIIYDETELLKTLKSKY